MKSILLFGLTFLGSCSQAHEAPQANKAAKITEASKVVAEANAVSNEANTVLRGGRTPLAEPKGPIDPKSAEAAGQVVQHYGALIEQHRSEEAEKLWSNANGASEVRSRLAPYPEIHLEIGKPGDPEGAAGSSYVTVPVVFYGKDQSGAPLKVAADVILRRVNDVPGSTEAQRHWHIERIDWKRAG